MHWEKIPGYGNSTDKTSASLDEVGVIEMEKNGRRDDGKVCRNTSGVQNGPQAHCQPGHRLPFQRWPILPQVLDSTTPVENRRRWRCAENKTRGEVRAQEECPSRKES